jgi:hypothetical protein
LAAELATRLVCPAGGLPFETDAVFVDTGLGNAAAAADTPRGASDAGPDAAPGAPPATIGFDSRAFLSSTESLRPQQGQ